MIAAAIGKPEMQTRGAALCYFTQREGDKLVRLQVTSANDEWPVSERDVLIVPLACSDDGFAKPPNVVSMFARPPALKR